MKSLLILTYLTQEISRCPKMQVDKSHRMLKMQELYGKVVAQRSRETRVTLFSRHLIKSAVLCIICNVAARLVFWILVRMRCKAARVFRG